MNQKIDPTPNPREDRPKGVFGWQGLLLAAGLFTLILILKFTGV